MSTSTTNEESTMTGSQRTVTHSGWVHTQIKQADGTWWNIRVERV